MWNLSATAAAVLILLTTFTAAFRIAGEKVADAAVCHQLATTASLRDAAVSYVLANHASLGIAGGTTVSLDPTILVAAGGLPPGWQNLGPRDSTNAVRVRNTGAGYDVLTLSHGGYELDERQVHASVTCGAPGLAFVDSDSPTTIITASHGERAQAADFHSAGAPVEQGRLMFLDHIGPGQVVPPYLHRFAVPGTDANRMHTAIDMNNNDVDDAGTVNTDTLNAGTATVAGDATVGGNATVAGLLTGTDSVFTGDVVATAFLYLSDRNEKTDIEDIVCRDPQQLRRLLPKSYRWKATGERNIPKGRLVVMQAELNLYMMHCLLPPTALDRTAEPPAPRACTAVEARVVATRQSRDAPMHGWPTFAVSIPPQDSGTGAWAEISGPTMRRYCPHLWSACVDGNRTYTCRRRDHSVATYPVIQSTESDGGSP
jgi:hypothetical protein